MQTVEIDRGLPAAIDAEKSIMGAVLLDDKMIPPGITPDDFYLDGHRRIFKTMLDLSAKGIPVDLMTLTDELQRRKDLDAAGGVAYVASLTDGLPRRPSIDQYVRIVLEKAHLRQIINACNNTISKALDCEPVSDCSAEIEQTIIAIEARRQGAETYHVSEFMPHTVVQLQEQASKGGLVGMTTGIRGLDDATTGIRPSELWVVGALAARGKTAFGVQMLAENAKNGVPGMMFSLEMTRFEVGCRLLSAYSGLTANRIRNPEFIGKDGWGPILRTEQDIEKWPLWINDASRIKLNELLLRAKMYIRSKGVKLILVDYLMLVDAPGRELRERADQIARGMKAIAKSENVSVILLSQFKRPQSINDVPNQTWFKESGGIEAEANVALAIHREVDDQNRFVEGKDRIIVVKQRNGEPGSVPVLYDRKTLQFRDGVPE